MAPEYNLLQHGPECGGLNSWAGSHAADVEADLRRPGRKVDVMSDAEYKRQTDAAMLPGKWDRVFKKEVGRQNAFFRHAMVSHLQSCIKAEKGEEESYRKAFDSWSSDLARHFAALKLFQSAVQMGVDAPPREKKDLVGPGKSFGSLSHLVQAKLDIYPPSEPEVEKIFEIYRTHVCSNLLSPSSSPLLGRYIKAQTKKELTQTQKPESTVAGNYFTQQSKDTTTEPAKKILASLTKDNKLRGGIESHATMTMDTLNRLVEETAFIRKEAGQPHAVDMAEGLKMRYESIILNSAKTLKDMVPEDKGKKLDLSYTAFDVNAMF